VFLLGDRSEGQRPYTAMTALRPVEDAAVACSQAWIAENHTTPNPVGQMAQLSGLPERTFKRRFRAATGYTPVAYVQALRVEEAKRLLEASDLPADEIGARVGYEDPTSFRRLFERSVGLTPRATGGASAGSGWRTGRSQAVSGGGDRLDLMATPVKRPANYEDLRQVPPHRVAELVGGELHASPRPAFRHALAASRLGTELGGPFDRGRGGPGGWWLLFEPELHLGEDVLVPDLAGWRRERMPELPDVAACTLAPDWICEVVSPSTERLDRAKKMQAYARENVAFLWLLNPGTRTLEVYRLSEGRWLLLATHEGGEVVRAEPFEAVGLELGPLWGEADQP
jgi:AraC-like DNA-binding protein